MVSRFDLYGVNAINTVFSSTVKINASGRCVRWPAPFGGIQWDISIVIRWDVVNNWSEKKQSVICAAGYRKICLHIFHIRLDIFSH